MVKVFITDLNKNTTRFMQEFTGEKQSVAQVSQVRMNAKFPSVTEGFEHFRLLRQIFILAIFYVAPVDERLKVRAISNTIGRIEIDRLHLPCHAFFNQQ